MEETTTTLVTSSYEESKTNKVFQLFSTVTTGFEHIAAEEAKEVFGDATKIYYDRKLLPGRVFFSITDFDTAVQKLIQMKSFEHLQAHIARIEGIQDNLEYFTQLGKDDSFISQEQWNDGLSLWRTYCKEVKGIKNLTLLNNPMFRVTGKCAGEHKISSSDMATAFAEGVKQRFPSWRSCVKGFELEIIVYRRDNSAFIELVLNEESISLQQVNKNRQLSSTPLRPAIAYSLFKMANIVHGEIVLDPLCGCGTISEISSINSSKISSFHIAGDIDPIAVSKASNNFALSFPKTSHTDCLQWNSTSLPFRSNFIDCIITDLPFGKRSGSHFTNVKLYPKLFAEFGRIINKKSGRAVVLTTEKKLIFEAAKKSKCWQIHKMHVINQGGLQDSVVFLLVPKQRDDEIEEKNAKKQKIE